MDQAKIGKYIAGKRKALGLTQAQLAGKLGMSDKSVSKWERGICLPDVSVYMRLCDILGITLNEFIAGEDIDIKEIPLKSEENLMQVAADAGKKRKKLIAISLILAIIALILGMALFLHFAFLPTKDHMRNISETDAAMYLDTASQNPARSIVRTYTRPEYEKLSQGELSELEETVGGKIEGDIPGLLLSDSRVRPVLQSSNVTGAEADEMPEYKITVRVNGAEEMELQEDGGMFTLQGQVCRDEEGYYIDMEELLSSKLETGREIYEFFCLLELDFQIDGGEYVTVTGFYVIPD